MPLQPMRLKVLLPFRVFADMSDVTRIVAETAEGAFGLLPQRLDCVAALVPGILGLHRAAAGEVFIAVDAGVLVKFGSEVLVTVRRAVMGTDLAQLRASVQQEFLSVDTEERNMRSVMAKLESGFLHRFARFADE